MTSSRVLLTGGAGFIGSRLAEALLAEGYSVHVADDLSSGAREQVPGEAELHELDLGDTDSVAGLPDAGFDAVLHLAGQSSGEKSFDDPLRDLDANARSTVLLAHWAREHGVPALVHASSMGVYGQVESHPVGENTPARPVSWYGASKLAAERALAAAPGIRTLSLRMFSVYGPGQDLAEMRQGMVSIYLAYMLRGEPVEVRGSLDRVRDFVFVGDVVEAWLRALRSGATGPVNVGTGVGTRVAELIELLGQAAGIEPEVREADGTPGDQFALSADVTRARDALGWEPATPLPDGLRELVDWARA